MDALTTAPPLPLAAGWPADPWCVSGPHRAQDGRAVWRVGRWHGGPAMHECMTPATAATLAAQLNHEDLHATTA